MLTEERDVLVVNASAVFLNKVKDLSRWFENEEEKRENLFTWSRLFLLDGKKEGRIRFVDRSKFIFRRISDEFEQFCRRPTRETSSYWTSSETKRVVRRFFVGCPRNVEKLITNRESSRETRSASVVRWVFGVMGDELVVRLCVCSLKTSAKRVVGRVEFDSTSSSRLSEIESARIWPMWKPSSVTRRARTEPQSIVQPSNIWFGRYSANKDKFPTEKSNSWLNDSVWLGSIQSGLSLSGHWFESTEQFSSRLLVKFRQVRRIIVRRWIDARPLV